MRAELSIHQEIVSFIPALYRFGSRFHKNKSDLDDLVQDTLLRALKASPSFRADTNLKSWLFTIMRNAHYSNYSKAKRVTVNSESVEYLMPATPPEQEWVVRKGELDRALAVMPGVYREVFHFVVEDGDPYDVAAAKCAISVGTVKSRVNRAKHFLAKHMGDIVSNAALI